jgi:hypothetical protein
MIRKSFRLALLSACAFALAQMPSFAYQLDKTNRVVSVAPGSSASATTTDLRSAMAYLVNRTDKDMLWTLKFAPGKYILSAQVSASGLQNTVLRSDPANPAQLIKMPGWNSASSAEYLLHLRMPRNVQIIGLEFYGQTTFATDSNPVWADQGLYIGSGNVVKVDSNKFFNFGNSALRVVTDARDPVTGVNSFKTQVSNNTFNNVYQTSTTSTDTLHGGTAMSTWTNNTFVNLRGSVKFASRTAGAKLIEFVNNTINGGDHFGLEIDNYNDFSIKGNKFQNIKEYAITIYTNGSATTMVSGFPWGDNYTIANNNIQNVGYAIRYSHAPFFDGTQNIPKNLIIDNNTISQVKTTVSYIPAILVTSGVVDGAKVTNNKFYTITNKKYISVQQGSTNVTILGNMVDGVAYGPQPTTALK